MRQKGGKTDLVSSLKCFLGEWIMLCKLMQVFGEGEGVVRIGLRLLSILNFCWGYSAVLSGSMSSSVVWY